MQYLRAYEYIFEQPNWLKNVLLCAVCNFIPVIGMIVLMGYLCEVFDALRRREESPAYPDFDFGRFTEYLTRGVWPFLAVMVASLAMIPVLWGIMFAIFIAGAAASQAHSIALAIVVVIGVLIYLACIIGMNLLLEPLFIRAIILRCFKAVFSLEFVWDFIRRMFWHLILVQLFLMVSGIAWTMAGFMLFCVGIYFVMPVIMYAQFHLRYQLYEEYLRRGGMEARG